MHGNGSVLELIAAAVISGGVVSVAIGILFKGFVTRIESEVRSRRGWKEASVADLLGPLVMQFDRTRRAYGRWDAKNLFLEAQIVKVGNQRIRDLLLEKGHLIPPDLLQDAGRLVEHYDVWLEAFDRHRLAAAPGPEAAFVFAGPEGHPFPSDSEQRFKARFAEYWNDLYANA